MKLAKYHGCGNDFLMGVWQEDVDYSALAIKYCDRHSGVGADGVIVGKNNNGRYEMVFYNADGSRAPMCGNGIRCLVAYLKDEKLINGSSVEIDTLSGIRTIIIKDYTYVVNMGKPSYDKNLLDIDCKGKDFLNQIMTYKGKEYEVNGIFMTTHHVVIPVDDLDVPEDVGMYFCKNPIFTKGMNVDFVKVVDSNNILIKTYERGVGWTKNCGSGSCASFVILNNKGLVDKEINVKLEYGMLHITKDNEDIIMEGPAEKICDISI